MSVTAGIRLLLEDPVVFRGIAWLDERKRANVSLGFVDMERWLPASRDRLRAGRYYVARNGDTARTNACATSYAQKHRNGR